MHPNMEMQQVKQLYQLKMVRRNRVIPLLIGWRNRVIIVRTR
jgi:hypothetical protein